MGVDYRRRRQSKLKASNRPAVAAVLYVPRQEVNERLPPPTSIPSKPTVRTAWLASRRSRRCRWSPRVRRPLSVADRRHLPELLRLVLRPAAGFADDLGASRPTPESADWYNSSYIIAWGSNVPQTRTPDAHFFTEVRYKGTKTVAITPDYAEIAKLAICGWRRSRVPMPRWRWRWAM